MFVGKANKPNSCNRNLKNDETLDSDWDMDIEDVRDLNNVGILEDNALIVIEPDKYLNDEDRRDRDSLMVSDEINERYKDGSLEMYWLTAKYPVIYL